MESGSTWPEQNAIHRVNDELGLGLANDTLLTLSKAATEYRLTFSRHDPLPSETKGPPQQRGISQAESDARVAEAVEMAVQGKPSIHGLLQPLIDKAVRDERKAVVAFLRAEIEKNTEPTSVHARTEALVLRQMAQMIGWGAHAIRAPGDLTA